MKRLSSTVSTTPRRALPSRPQHATRSFATIWRTAVGKAATIAIAGGIAVSGAAVLASSVLNAPIANAINDPAAAPNINEIAAQRNTEIAADGRAVGQIKAQSAWEARQEQINADANTVLTEAKRSEQLNQFLWPTEGGVSPGNEYGPRYHPILHRTRLHDGVDISSKCGQPIYAAQSGTVVKTTNGYSGGAGNSVKIDHGDYDGIQIQTAYLHMSKYVVSDQAKINKGDLVGYVGSTGLSTGCHLHLSLTKDGKSANPLEYVKPVK